MLTFGTCGLNSTALCIASTAAISTVVRPLLLAISGENLPERRLRYQCWSHPQAHTALQPIIFTTMRISHFIQE
jgi:hypothetical protein